MLYDEDNRAMDTEGNNNENADGNPEPSEVNFVMRNPEPEQGYDGQTSQAGQGYDAQAGQGSGSQASQPSQNYESRPSQPAEGYGVPSASDSTWQTSRMGSQGYGSSDQSGYGYSAQTGQQSYGYQSQPNQQASGYQSQANQQTSGYQSQVNQQTSGYQGQANQQTYGNQSQAGQQAYGSQSQPGQQTYGYQSQADQQAYGSQTPQAPVQEPKHKKEKNKNKKPGLFKKTVGIIAAGLLFGFVSGGVMVGVNMVADSMKETQPAQTVGQQEQVSLSEEDMDKIVNRIERDTENGKMMAMDVSDIVEAAMPSVVAINNTMYYQSNIPWFGQTQTYEVPSAGSGIIVGQNDSELLIATNDHVVENASDLSVVFIDDTELDATVKGTDSESDLAIVAVPLDSIPAETMNKISIAEMGNSEELKIGQGVIAIGNALGYGQAVTVGYVSALDREVQTDGVTKKLIQTDAAINPGNSGGALLNMQGQLIGINEAKYSDTEVEGMGFAIPISQAEEILDTLMVRRSGEQVKEDEAGYLGIQGVTVDDTMVKEFDMPAGVYVYRIVEGGAASKTDLHEKDVITKFDGQRVMTMASLQDLLKYYKKGETVEMVVESLVDGEYVERTINITLGEQVSAE